MSEDIVQGVIETVDSANQYRIQLTELMECLQEAKVQVKDSSEKSRNEIRNHFEQFRSAILSALEERETHLQSEIISIEKSALQPLEECKHLIQQGLNSATKVMNEGKNLLMSGNHEGDKDAMIGFKTTANNLGLNSLPEVPSLSEVVCLSVELPVCVKDQLTQTIRDHGRVISRGPVQISHIEERPGSLLISWAEIEEDLGVDISEYRLQYCRGAFKGIDDPNAVYHEAYQGHSKSYRICQLNKMVSYTFRVCGRAEGAQAWSPWSVPYVSMTMLPHYAWQSSVPCYLTSNEDKIACRDKSVSQRLLYSNVSSFVCGHTISFKIVEVGRPGQEDGIGLSVTNKSTDSLKQPGALFVTTDGHVYIDGQEMTTRLPVLQAGSVLTLDTEMLQSGKVRASIELADKSVTVDWNIEKPAETETNNPLASVVFGFGSESSNKKTINLYFACRFDSEGWKMSVE